MRRVRIACKPYASHVEIAVGPLAEARPWYAKRTGDTLADDDGGATHTPEDGTSITCWSEDTGAMLVHELVHVAVAVLQRAGVPVSAENDEALAYLVSHLYETVCKRLAAKPRAPRPRKQKNPPPAASSGLQP